MANEKVNKKKNNIYFLVHPATARFQMTCDICSEYKKIYNINYYNYKEVGPVGFVCSEGCFNLWLLQQ